MDPGFPVEGRRPVGGTPTSDTGTFRQKHTCENERIGSGGRTAAPPGSTTEYNCLHETGILPNYTVSQRHLLIFGKFNKINQNPWILTWTSETISDLQPRSTDTDTSNDTLINYFITELN